MAREIRETPILTGKDAARFDKLAKEKAKQKVSAEEFKRAKVAYEIFGFAKKAD